MASADQKRRALEKAFEAFKANAGSGHPNMAPDILETFFRKFVELEEDCDKDD